MPNEKKESAVAFLQAAVPYYLSLGITASPPEVNGSYYKACASCDACQALGLKHIRTRPTRPCSMERQSLSPRPASESDYANAYPSSEYRDAELLRWLHRYNLHRTHGSLQYQRHISRLNLPENNLLRLNS